MIEKQQPTHRKLSEYQHILKRSSMYIGSVSLEDKEMFVLRDKEFKFETIKFIPGLLKIINEIIDNSVDEAIRTNFEFSNKIEVDIDIQSGIITVKDNGRGIPVKKDEELGIWIPELCWCHARAGSSFDEDMSTTIGTNGVGSFATLVFSEKFTGITCDGKNQLTLENDGTEFGTKIDIKKSSKTGTTVIFKPKYDFFKIEKLDKNHIDLIKQRIFVLAITYPQIKFFFNKEKININQNNFFKMFGENFEVYNSEKYSFAIFPNEFDDFKHSSFIDGLVVPYGGTHINFLASKIINLLKEKLSKKYKDIKIGDIKNKIQIVTILKEFPNKRWSSQTKEELTNSESELKNYFGEIPFEKIVQRILKNEFIITPIIETYKIKEELKDRKALETIKTTKKIRIENYIPALKEKKYLFLSEGHSANGLISRVIGREKCGFFPLKGKPLNCLELPYSKIISNEEINNILTIIKSEKYENIVIATDMDADGTSIKGLLLVFFYKFFPEKIKEGKIFFLKTPLIIARKNKKIERFFFNLSDYKKFEKENSGFTFDYLKGLGSNIPEELSEIFEKEGGFEKFLLPFKYEEILEEKLNLWFSKQNSDKRKEELLGFSFDINSL